MHTIRHVTHVLAAFAMVACASDSSTAPRSQTPAASASVATSGSLTCDPTFAQSNADARAFFASESDPAFVTLRHMQSFYASGGPTAATNSGFDALQDIGDARLTDRQGGTAASGNALAKDLLACMEVGPIPSDFDATAALSTGIFEVRGGYGDNAGAALAQTTVAGERSATSPVWGIESLGGWGAVFEGKTTRMLVYGAPLPVSSFAADPAATDPDNAAYTGFDISTLPAMPGLTLITDGQPGQVRVGICIDAASGTEPNLLVHAGTSGTTALQLSAPSFCGDVASSAAPHGFLATLAHGALSLFTPTPAYASIGGVGGLPSGLSPFGPIKVQTDSVVLTFTTQPSDGKISAPISPAVQVKATTAKGTPIGGVQITLSIVRNHGINAGLAVDTVEITSDAPGMAGIATFQNLHVTKAGGYIIQAQGSLGGHATTSVTSVLFNMKNK